MGDNAMYVMVGLALLVLGFAIFATPSQQTGQQAAGGGYQLQQAQGPVPSKCGDINDPKNLQHLSHHPDQFQDCYPYVDPGKFQQAVGQPLSNFMRG
ncbi:MAG: hypothetical protein QW568_04715 [Candidatus Anstonellaceae archaeon]